MLRRFVGKCMAAAVIGVAISAFLLAGNYGKDNTAELLAAGEVFDNEIGQIDESEEELNESLMFLDVRADVLNVRDDANGNKIAKVRKDERFLIFGEKDGWYLILLEDEKAGWVCGKYVDVYYPNGNIYLLASAYNKDAGGAVNPADALTTNTNVASQAQLQAQMEALIAAQNQAALEAQTQAEALIAAQNQAALEAQAQAEALAKQLAEAQNQAALEAQAQLEAYQAALAAQAQAALEAQQKAMAEAAKAQPWLTKEWTSLTNSELISWAIASCIRPGMSAYEQCVAVNNFLCDHMTYDLSYYTTRDALMYGVGRCQGYANAFKDIMNTLGVPTDYVRGYGKGGRHGWNRVNIGGVYYYVDVTWNDSTSSSKWLMVSEEQILRDHVITQYSATNTQ